MTHIVELIVVVVAVALAAGYLVSRVYRRVAGGRKCGGGCSCGSSESTAGGPSQVSLTVGGHNLSSPGARR